MHAENSLGQGERIGRKDSAADGAGVYRIVRSGIERVTAGAIVVGEWAMAAPGVGRSPGNCPGGGENGNMTPRRTAAPEVMAELVGKRRFQVVGALAARDGGRARGCVDGLVVVAEEDVGVENLAYECCGSAGADARSGRQNIRRRVQTCG